MIIGIRLPSLKQVIIWLLIISCISFSLGGIITVIDGDKYKATGSERITLVNNSPGNIKNAVISLEMDTGSINLSAGNTSSLISGTISGKNSKEGPNQSYQSVDGTGYLTIRQELSMPYEPLTKEDDWNFSLNQDVPTSLFIASGSGRVSIRSGHANLTCLDVDLGSGDLIVDLAGWRGSHLPVSITGGLGSMNILLPLNTSIAANLEAGIGSRTIKGLEGGDGSYYHTVSDTPGHVISLLVNQGIGDLTLEVAS